MELLQVQTTVDRQKCVAFLIQNVNGAEIPTVLSKHPAMTLCRLARALVENI